MVQGSRLGFYGMVRQLDRLISGTKAVRPTEMQIRPRQIKLTTAAAPVVQSRRKNVSRNARNVLSEAIKRQNDELQDRISGARYFQFVDR